ncbi:MAG: acyl-CoA reductase [Candidatus Omnitrophica bacterium]|nr:acyl-CoA reductase [Candidatus Omnitrophota bacterium]
MQVLIPKTNKDWREVLRELIQNKPLMPFEKISLDFIEELSGRLAEDKSLEKYPELNFLIRWINKGHLNWLYQEYENRRQNRIWIPRGVVLHFPPANIDTLFIYSWFLSLLVGNINIIRLSQDYEEQAEILLRIVEMLLEEEKFNLIKERILLLTYGHDDKITEELSKYCNIRVIWGGDETIKKIRAIPLPPRAIELVFADRFSLAVINAERILIDNDEQIKDICRGLYTDTLFYTQKACFSPKLIIWIGKEDTVDKAKDKFWVIFKEFYQQQSLEMEDAIYINRMVNGYYYAGTGLGDKLYNINGEFPYRVHIKEIVPSIREIHMGGGVFLEAENDVLEGIVSNLVYKDQTLCVYGFSKEEIEEFTNKLGGYGIDRIVPIGKGANFSYVWDGYDLFTYLTREVIIDL